MFDRATLKFAYLWSFTCFVFWRGGQHSDLLRDEVWVEGLPRGKQSVFHHKLEKGLCIPD
jgi:hypothetical protein